MTTMVMGSTAFDIPASSSVSPSTADNTDTAGVVLLGFDDPEMIREVAAYWYDELLVSEVGRAMHQGLLDAALPRGAVAIGAGATSPHS